MMKLLFAPFKALFVMTLVALVALTLFRNSIARAIASHPLITPVNDAGTTPLPILHFSPDENLEQLDMQRLAQAKERIDISMYAFTDRALAEVLRGLAQRGIEIRLYRDQEQFHDEQFARRQPYSSTSDMLRGLSSVHIRVKRGSPRDLMHQKDYCVDGKLLREGSANWSPSAEKAQDNSFWISTDAAEIARYERKFDEMWDRSSNLPVQ